MLLQHYLIHIFPNILYKKGRKHTLMVEGQNNNKIVKYFLVIFNF